MPDSPPGHSDSRGSSASPSLSNRTDLSNIGSKRSTRSTLTIVSKKGRGRKLAVDLQAITESRAQQEPTNFLVHNVPLLLEENSLFILGPKNWFRQKVLELILHPYFEKFILFSIMANAIILGIVDYRYVDSDNNLNSSSIRNLIEAKSSVVFIAIFTFEMVLKVIAYGVTSIHKGYLRDFWHWLDLLVIVTGILVEVSPSTPTLNVIRLFRLLRPLRSIEKLPALKRIVVCILESFPQLGGVVFLLSFIFWIYSIFGLQLFLGPQLHTACRSTPYPVNITYIANSGMDYVAYKCLDVPNFDRSSDVISYTKETSPWATPQVNCYWPVATDDIVMQNSDSRRFCSFDFKTQGINVCINNEETIAENSWSWCGSNMDAYGNMRFGDSIYRDPATYYADLNYGLTNFDNFGRAILVIYITLTQSGWVALMNFCRDSSGEISSLVYFLSLILIGPFLVLQLLLVVLADNFEDKLDDHEDKSNFDKQTQTLHDEFLKALTRDDDDDYDIPGITSSFGNGSRKKSSVGISPSKRNTSPDPSLSSLSPPLTRSLSRRESRRSSDFLIDALKIQALDNSKAWGFKEYSKITLKFFDILWRKKIRRNMYFISRSMMFEYASSCIIFSNLIILMIDHHPMDKELYYQLDAANAIMSIIFAVEALIKILGSNFKVYFRDLYQVLDFVVVVISLVEIIVYPPYLFSHKDTAKYISINIIRSFKLFRIIKLAAKFKFIRILLARVMRTFLDMFSYIILLFLFLYITTLLGMQLFANRLRFDKNGFPITQIHSAAWYNAPDTPRSNFDDFNSAFASVFQLMTTENWTAILLDLYRSQGPLGTLFPCIIVCIGTFILMNLFLAILISNFESISVFEEELQSMAGAKVAPINKIIDASRRVSAFVMISLASFSPRKFSKTSDSEFISPVPIMPSKSSEVALMAPDSSSVNVIPNVRIGSLIGNNSEGDDESHSECDSDSDSSSHRNDLERENMLKSAMLTGTVVEAQVEAQVDNNTYSLGILSKNNLLRITCSQIISHFLFEPFILFLVVLSSITLALENPLIDPLSIRAKVVSMSDVIITLLFLTELFVKVVANDLFWNKESYLRNNWNKLDFAIVAVSVSQLSVDYFLADTLAPNLSTLKVIRAIRTVRPLRAISRLKRLRVVLNAIFSAIPDFINVFLLAAILFSLFAIGLVNILKGDLRSCQGDIYNTISTNSSYLGFLQAPRPWNDMTYEQKAWFGPNSEFSSSFSSSACTTLWPSIDCCGIFTDTFVTPTSHDVCSCWGGSWLIVTDQVFDNYPVALMGLFEIATTEGWVDVMYAAVDSNGVDMQPIENNRQAFIYFFICFMVVGYFFALNLLIGVLLENFSRSRKQQVFGFSNLPITESQDLWLKTLEVAMMMKPKAKKVEMLPGTTSFSIIHIVENKYFEPFVMVIIASNAISLSLFYVDDSTLYSTTLEVLNFYFAVFFSFEALLKLCAYGKAFFSKGWNIFDLTIVVISDIGLVLVNVSGLNDVLIITAFRVFRVLRIVKLLRGFSKVKRLVDAILRCLPGLLNIVLLLMLCLFVYATLGVQLFAKIGYSGSYDVHKNFRTLGSALVTLIGFGTGEGWPTYMTDVGYQAPGCTLDPNYNNSYCGFNDHPGCLPLDGCGSYAIYPYMLSYVFLVCICLFNMFVGIILEGFQASKNEKLVSQEDFDRFAEHWAHYDPECTYFIGVEQLENFILKLYQPLGYGRSSIDHKEIPVNELADRIANLHLHIWSDNKLHFRDVLMALVTDAIKRKENEADLEEFIKVRIKDICAIHHMRHEEEHRGALGLIQSRLRVFRGERDIDLKYKRMRDGSVLTLRQFYAGQILLRSYRNWKCRRVKRAVIEASIIMKRVVEEEASQSMRDE